jgi:energy-coupling factor transporter ATP-binding protein EcfA2
LISIKAGEHVLSLGKTGTGKSVLIRYVANGFKNLIVFDNNVERKDNQRWANVCDVTVTGLPFLIEAWNDDKHRKIHFMVSEVIDDKNLRKLYDSVCRLAFKVGNVAVVNDELGDVQGSGYHAIGQWARYLHRSGRRRGVTCLDASQRPADINKGIYQNVSHLFAFKFNLYDIQNVSYIPQVELTIRLRKELHCYLYYDLDSENPNPKMCNPIPLKEWEKV